MTEYRIVASDLDGTLLASDGSVSAENREAIKRLSEKGVYVVPCTGRTLYELNPEIRNNPYIRYIIHSDGSVIYDKENDRRIEMCMTREVTNRLFDELAKQPTFYSVRYNRNVYNDAALQSDAVYNSFAIDPYSRNVVIPWSKKLDDFDAFCRSCESIEMVGVFFQSLEARDRCLERLEALGDYGFIRWQGLNYSEIFSKEAGKGNALLRLAKELDLDRSQTIGVGDSTNDLTMIRAAGLGLAMSNACEALKAEADEIICSNDEHGIQYILDRYIK